jgi:hypothetical protein
MPLHPLGATCRSRGQVPGCCRELGGRQPEAMAERSLESAVTAQAPASFGIVSVVVLGRFRGYGRTGSGRADQLRVVRSGYLRRPTSLSLSRGLTHWQVRVGLEVRSWVFLRLVTVSRVRVMVIMIMIIRRLSDRDSNHGCVTVAHRYRRDLIPRQVQLRPVWPRPGRRPGARAASPAPGPPVQPASRLLATVTGWPGPRPPGRPCSLPGRPGCRDPDT